MSKFQKTIFPTFGPNEAAAANAFAAEASYKFNVRQVRTDQTVGIGYAAPYENQAGTTVGKTHVVSVGFLDQVRRMFLF